MFPISFLSFVLFLILHRSAATLGSGFAHPSTLVLGVGPELVQVQYTLAGAPEVEQALAILRMTSVSLRPQLDLS